MTKTELNEKVSAAIAAWEADNARIEREATAAAVAAVKRVRELNKPGNAALMDEMCDLLDEWGELDDWRKRWPF